MPVRGLEEFRDLAPVNRVEVVEPEGQPASLAVVGRLAEPAVLPQGVLLERVGYGGRERPDAFHRERGGEAAPLKIANRRRPTRNSGRFWSSPSSAPVNPSQIARTRRRASASVRSSAGTHDSLSDHG